MNWLLKLLFVVIGELMTAIIEVFAKFINNIFAVMYQINKNLPLDGVKNWTTGIALTLVVTIALKRILSVYLLQTEGDADSDPLEIFTRVSIAIATILCGREIMDFIISMATNLSSEAISRFGKSKTDIASIAKTLVTSLLASTTAQNLVYLIFIAIILISFFIFVFKAGRRGAELILFSILLPLVACDLVTTQRERWNSFVTEMLLCIFGYIVQLISFSIFAILFGKIGQAMELKYIIAALAWMSLVLNAPKWTQKFIYTTGIGNGLKGAGRTATFILPSILRR